MRNSIYISLLLPIALSIVGCSNLDEPLPGGDSVCGNSVRFTVMDFEGEDGSRSAIDATGKFSWTAGDTLGVFPEEGYQTAFPISEGTGTSSALFDGGLWALRPNARYAAYFPFLHPMDKIHMNAIPVSYEGQKQIGNNSTAHLGSYDYIAAPFTDVNEHGGTTFQMNHLGCIVRFSLTMPEAASYRSLIIRTNDNNLITSGNYDLCGSLAISPTTTTNALTLGIENISTTQANQTIVLYMMMAPQDLRSTPLTINVVGTEDIYHATLIGKEMIAGKAYSYTATCHAQNNGISHEYVDLGLPSGTLWASCNVGASYPEEYGEYFAWGETAPQSAGQYTWSSYLWCNGTYNSLTKYCNNSSYGTVDNKLELSPDDDAANINWGPAWKMPTISQIQELYNSSYTTTTGYEMNGVYGRLITSKRNGNSIFLPAAGYRSDGADRDARSFGFYWSSEAHSTYSYYGCYLYFYSKGIEWGYNGRYIGRSVRPVRASK